MNTRTARTTAIHGATIAYDIAGPAGAAAIVLLHPAFADKHVFEFQIAAFAERYRVVSIDLPGHGDTTTRRTGVAMKDAPDIVARVLRENGIDSAHLIGVSLGSLVAQAFADKYPESTRSVAAVGGYSIHRPIARVIKAQRKEAFKWLLYVVFSMRKFRSYVLKVSCFTEQGRALFERGIARFARKSFASMAGMNKLFRRSNAPVPYPLLIVVGEHDMPLARAAAADWHTAEPDAEYALIAGAGHCANADAPEAFNAIVYRFVSSVDH
ncbi:alpha/beta fold hydrolase [Cohnella sp. GCM10027633]|uniref:alpha/beta fold hydrolase n=1 Tax=unclassified Cohnella TaxID=2636738 RepID=UPI0036338663